MASHVRSVARPRSPKLRRYWVDGPTLLIIGVAVGLVVAMALALEGRQLALPPGMGGPTLQDFQRANPHLSVREEHVGDPTWQSPGQRPGFVLLHLEDTRTGARATLREDFLLGHPVRLQECPADLPVAPLLREVQCVTAAASGKLPEVLWLSARLPEGGDGPDVAHERLQPFYAAADAAAGEMHTLVLHRISAERVAVALAPRTAQAAQ